MAPTSVVVGTDSALFLSLSLVVEVVEVVHPSMNWCAESYYGYRKSPKVESVN
jgi:predicted RNase H-related nuclease YkuK (DUF458 family)